MYRPVTVKICGLTREADVDLALELGADYCGFIVYPKSPRGISLERAMELASRVPEGRRVLVDVETGTEELEARRDAGFDFFQIHTGLDIGLASLAGWSGLVGRERLWVAPRLKPGDVFPEMVYEFADTVLLDTYHKDRVGGTGETGDWDGFAKLKQQNPATRWILAGGLNPQNALEAIAATGAGCVDVNSGVETEPGMKSPEKLRELFGALKPS
ncbi:phosphoribosylanthranilate isomerase [Coraliomargarita sinensis]|uniref:N-(5'-phosphoribosyl)anthranilate isomerase n=1 Tax=Coraliomargarita sinensis TaxID=2174842 RepID=A0A317ZI06_9BACT|nr:phosphoribosylanthranilate isomerase [Coraliomargarita sinensis]PXA05206.1 phosphoribosylanthranilate isomerase [Coraliomargarita sinensis]